MTKLVGGCFCGHVRYDLGDSLSGSHAYSCYCRDCQYITGGAPNHVIYIPRKMKLISGEVSCYSTISERGIKIARYFCKTCGTHIYGESESMSDATFLKVGTLDDASVFDSQENLWVSSRQHWHYLESHLRNWDKCPIVEE